MKWRDEDRAEWERLCRLAWRLKTYGGRYDVKTLHARNDGMITETERLDGSAVAVWDPRKTEGGTASAAQKLIAAGLPIIHVNPETRTTTLCSPRRAAA